MKTIGNLMFAVGVVLFLGWAMSDPMDEETALFRYGHADGRAASTSEVLEARERSSPEQASTWLLVGGLILGSGGFLIRRSASAR